MDGLTLESAMSSMKALREHGHVLSCMRINLIRSGVRAGKFSFGDIGTSHEELKRMEVGFAVEAAQGLLDFLIKTRQEDESIIREMRGCLENVGLTLGALTFKGKPLTEVALKELLGSCVRESDDSE